MLIIFATIMTLTTPTGSLSPDSCLIHLGIFRILLGVGVGGDYPMSASITSDRANLRKRGTMLAYIFSNQGWGSFFGSLVTIIVLLCYKSTMEAGHTSKVDGVWRICIAVSLIPAFATLYQRLTLPESVRFIKSQKLAHSEQGTPPPDEIDQLKAAQREEDKKAERDAAKATEKGEDSIEMTSSADESTDPSVLHPDAIVKKKAHFGGTLGVSEWLCPSLISVQNLSSTFPNGGTLNSSLERVCAGFCWTLRALFYATS